MAKRSMIATKFKLIVKWKINKNVEIPLILIKLTITRNAQYHIIHNHKNVLKNPCHCTKARHWSWPYKKNLNFLKNIFGILPQSFEIFPQSDYKGDEWARGWSWPCSTTILNSLDLTNSSHSLWQKFMPERLCTWQWQYFWGDRAH